MEQVSPLHEVATDEVNIHSKLAQIHRSIYGPVEKENKLKKRAACLYSVCFSFLILLDTNDFLFGSLLVAIAVLEILEFFYPSRKVPLQAKARSWFGKVLSFVASISPLVFFYGLQYFDRNLAGDLLTLYATVTSLVIYSYIAYQRIRSINE